MKSFLKKESCYTTIMSTARIRGVDRVYLMADYEPKLYKVTDDMTFGHLIAEACQTDQLTLDLLNNCYLVDRNKGMAFACIHPLPYCKFALVVTLYLVCVSPYVVSQRRYDMRHEMLTQHTINMRCNTKRVR